jgi:hypothetical protein
VENSFGGEAEPALAKVAFVHGVNITFGGPDQISDTWMSAALDGVALAGNKMEAAAAILAGIGPSMEPADG